MSWANLLHENDKFSCDSELFSWQVAMVGVGEIGESMECKKCANREPSNRKVPLFLLKEHALNTLRCMAEAGQLPFSSNHPLYM